jgi:CBS domain-containing protein
MKARDVMTLAVYTVKPTTSVKDVAHLFVERRISAAPVVDDQRKIVGIVSEGDLVHRSEISTQRRHPWWLVLMAGDEGLAADYIKAHAKQVADIMTRKVITAGPDTPLQEIAEMLEKYGIKRLPIVRDGQLVGIVSRVVRCHNTRKASHTPKQAKLGAYGGSQCDCQWRSGRFVGVRRIRYGTKSHSCRRRSSAGGPRRKRSHDRAANWLLIRLTWNEYSDRSEPHCTCRCHVAVLKYWYL